MNKPIVNSTTVSSTKSFIVDPLLYGKPYWEQSKINPHVKPDDTDWTTDERDFIKSVETDYIWTPSLAVTFATPSHVGRKETVARFKRAIENWCLKDVRCHILVFAGISITKSDTNAHIHATLLPEKDVNFFVDDLYIKLRQEVSVDAGVWIGRYLRGGRWASYAMLKSDHESLPLQVFCPSRKRQCREMHKGGCIYNSARASVLKSPLT